MTEVSAPPILVDFSRGRVSRADVARALGEPVSFGRLLTMLQAYDLPLPRYPSDPNAPGRVLLRRILQAAPADGRR
jgi:hypothetical protein